MLLGANEIGYEPRGKEDNCYIRWSSGHETRSRYLIPQANKTSLAKMLQRAFACPSESLPSPSYQVLLHRVFGFFDLSTSTFLFLEDPHNQPSSSSRTPTPTSGNFTTPITIRVGGVGLPQVVLLVLSWVMKTGSAMERAQNRQPARPRAP